MMAISNRTRWFARPRAAKARRQQPLQTNRALRFLRTLGSPASFERLEDRSLLSVTVTDIGTNQSNTAVSSLAISPSTAVPTNHLIVIASAVAGASNAHPGSI